jgi:2-oxoglutarate ferredoxin oxidoreductase subunit alpha
MRKNLTWKIGGEAGFGIMSAGNLLAKLVSRAGYSVLVTNEYPSLIRGGHNVITAKISTKKIHALTRELDILVALNKQTVELHRDQLKAGSVVVFDPGDYDWKKEELPDGVMPVPVPLSEITKSLGGVPVMRNTVALGATLGLLDVQIDRLRSVLADVFKKKKAEVVEENVKVAQAGYDSVKKQANLPDLKLEPVNEIAPQLVMTGNEAMGVSAVRAGMKFAAIYPMTPISAIIPYLAEHAKEFGIVYRQPEDEIAGIMMAIGAANAGVRSLVATSGGGFALMVEGVALAGMAEVGFVINMGMRVGPATGMPTWTEQGELRMVMHAGHGEFPKIVLAPGDAEEIFELTTAAFNFADRYQCPVFLLTDKYLNETIWCSRRELFAREVTVDRGKIVKETDLAAGKVYKRYTLEVEDGISPRSLPGMKNGVFTANSYEHDEFGISTEHPDERTKMATKRLTKNIAMEKDIVLPRITGDPDADLTFVTWGSTKGPVLEAAEMLRAKGHKVKVVQYLWIYPFPTVGTKEILGSAKRLVVVEQNATAQLAGVIREFSGIEISEKILNYNGRPFFPEEIIAKV